MNRRARGCKGGRSGEPQYEENGGSGSMDRQAAASRPARGGITMSAVGQWVGGGGGPGPRPTMACAEGPGPHDELFWKPLVWGLAPLVLGLLVWQWLFPGKQAARSNRDERTNASRSESRASFEPTEPRGVVHSSGERTRAQPEWGRLAYVTPAAPLPRWPWGPGHKGPSEEWRRNSTPAAAQKVRKQGISSGSLRMRPSGRDTEREARAQPVAEGRAATLSSEAAPRLGRAWRGPRASSKARCH